MILRRSYIFLYLTLAGLMLLKQGIMEADLLRCLFGISAACAVWILSREFSALDAGVGRHAQ